MNTPTRQAPHICDQLLAKMAPSCEGRTRNRITVMIQDARIAVPPTNGVQLNTAAILAPGVMAESAATAACSRMILGRLDHGPVHATTTTTSTAIGNQAMPTSAAERPCASACVSPVTGTPP